MRVGAVYFDSSGNIIGNDQTIISLGDAWASVGGEPARRVQSIHELASDVLWLTNLTYNNFYRTGLQRHPNFRNDGWLRTLFAQITTELGANPNDDGAPDVAVEVMSSIAQRVVDVAIKDYSVVVRSQRLNDDFAKALNIQPSKILDKLYPYFESIAEHPSVSVIQTANYSTGLPTITLRRNRLSHAKHVLSTPVPSDEGWQLQKITDSDSDRWLSELELPFLVRASVSNINPTIAEVLSWGSGSRHVREWMTDLEWRIVRELGDIEVQAVLVNNKPACLLPQAQMLPKVPFGELSYTLGLVAEQIWTALVSRQRHKDGSFRYTAAGAWLRAADRMAMFEYAQRLHARGITVMSYGVGNIVARYPEGGLRRALDVATDLDLIPPASKFIEARTEGITV